MLITAGPTWVAIDSVRVISNIATAQTGITLAEKLARQGARVTLLLGPGQYRKLDKKINVLRYRFFDELQKLLLRRLKNRDYAALIHSAAVSDYRVKNASSGKMPSGVRGRRLSLVPTPKLINSLKAYYPKALRVGFKLETSAAKESLIEGAKRLLKQAGLSMAVGNSLARNAYRAYILNKKGALYGPFSTKKTMAASLCRLICACLSRS